jgi:tetratricopeptide (TPR) repeat protein
VESEGADLKLFWRADVLSTVSRFINLEFEGESNRQNQPEHKLPAKDEAYYLHGANHAFENGNFDLALRNYSKVLEFNVKNVTAWTGQVRMLIELGEFREAKLWADKALERFPNEPELLAAKAVALARSGDLEAALTFSDAAIEEHGDTAYIWLARGDVLFARNEASADYCLEKAMTLTPKNWLVAWLAARIRIYYKQFAQALKAIEQAVEWNPGHFLMWLERGRCQVSLGLLGPAETSFTQARQLNPNCRAAEDELNRIRGTGFLKRLWHWPAKFFK